MKIRVPIITSIIRLYSKLSGLSYCIGLICGILFLYHKIIINEYIYEETNHIVQGLKNEIRIICIVMTSPDRHHSIAIHVKTTWGKRCDTLLFMSTAKDHSLPAISLPVSDNDNELWGKTKEAFKFVHKHYDDYDYVLKANDNTYVILENLRFMLTSYEPEDPVYLGCKFRPFVEQGFMSDGAGYVLSKEAVRMFVEEGILHKNCSQNNTGSADVEIGRCLELIGVKAGDSRDNLNRGRFFPFRPEEICYEPPNDPNFWFWKYNYYPTELKMENYSDTAISFYNINTNQMYALEYILYHLRPYGVFEKVDS